MESGERSCDKVRKCCVGQREEVWGGVREGNRSDLRGRVKLGDF